MDVTAKVGSRGQVTIPKHIREELRIEQGDELVFRVEPHRVLIARSPGLLDQALGVQAKSEPMRSVPWDAIRHTTARRHGHGRSVVEQPGGLRVVARR